MSVFPMPSLGADMEAGTLVEWLVKPGDKVKRGDVIAAVETQKGAIEIEVFQDGTVQELIAGLGQELPVGAPLAVILGEGEEPETPTTAEPAKAEPKPEPQPAATQPEPALAEAVAAPAPSPVQVPPPVATPGLMASPAARVRARELGVDLKTLTGSGPGGAILFGDVDKSPGAPAKKPRGTPMDEMRRAIAAAMTRAKQTIPHFYLSQTIDIQAATDWLTARNAGVPPADRILMGALFVRAATLAAAKSKTVNGHFTDGAFRPSAQVNTGVAVALRGGGLVAPALIDAVPLSLTETMAGMRDLVTRARAGRLRNTEMTGGTITVSALGDTGAETMTGVIFPPQVALVGIGAPQTRPWVVDGAVVPRQVVTVAISADHRVSDGRQIAAYLAEFETLLKDPENL